MGIIVKWGFLIFGILLLAMGSICLVYTFYLVFKDEEHKITIPLIAGGVPAFFIGVFIFAVSGAYVEEYYIYEKHKYIQESDVECIVKYTNQIITTKVEKAIPLIDEMKPEITKINKGVVLNELDHMRSDCRPEELFNHVNPTITKEEAKEILNEYNEVYKER